MNEYLPPTGREITREIKSKELVTYENKKRNLDLGLFRKRGNNKTFDGFLIQKMKEARNESNFDVAELLQYIYNEYKRFKESEEIILNGWKGKSSIKIFNKPDSFDIITFQKKDQDSSPEPVIRNVSKREVNEVIIGINKLNKGDEIKTRDIAELIYHEEWRNVFSDRFKHTNLNAILRLLDYYGIINYRGGKTKVIKSIKEVKEL